MDTRQPAQRVLVGVDGSPASVTALQQAAPIADAFGARLDAITVWESPPWTGFFPVGDWALEANARHLLYTTLEKAFPQSPPAFLTQIVLHGQAAEALIEASGHGSILVLGSHHHDKTPGLRHGSISARCIAHAHCPVLITHEGANQVELVTLAPSKVAATPHTFGDTPTRAELAPRTGRPSRLA